MRERDRCNLTDNAHKKIKENVLNVATEREGEIEKVTSEKERVRE